MIADMPRVMIISLKKETGIAVSTFCVTGARASIRLKKMNSKNAILQIMARREKKDNTFIK
jgi:hypothetical protein